MTTPSPKEAQKTPKTVHTSPTTHNDGVKEAPDLDAVRTIIGKFVKENGEDVGNFHYRLSFLVDPEDSRVDDIDGYNLAEAIAQHIAEQVEAEKYYTARQVLKELYNQGAIDSLVYTESLKNLAKLRREA